MNAVEDHDHDLVEDVPATAVDIIVVSKQDPDMSHFMDWPSLFDGSLKPYYRFCNELAIEARS